MDSIFVVSLVRINKDKGMWGYDDRPTSIGWFSTFEKAENFILTDGDLSEAGYYKYVVIECYKEGWSLLPVKINNKHQIWYKINEDDSVTKIEKPELPEYEDLKYIASYCFG